MKVSFTLHRPCYVQSPANRARGVLSITLRKLTIDELALLIEQHLIGLSSFALLDKSAPNSLIISDITSEHTNVADSQRFSAVLREVRTRQSIRFAQVRASKPIFWKNEIALSAEDNESGRYAVATL